MALFLGKKKTLYKQRSLKNCITKRDKFFLGDQNLITTSLTGNICPLSRTENRCSHYIRDSMEFRNF